jgi:phosphoglycerol transferase MdoB-like AlkP superfamily enzyme
MKTKPEYIKFILLNCIALFLFRLLETSIILLHFGNQEFLIVFEFLGFIYELSITSFVLLLLYPLYYFLFKISQKLADRLFLAGILIFVVLHFFILKFFLYQLTMLDIFFFKTSFQEIFFTVSTSNISFVKSFILLTFIVALLLLVNKVIWKVFITKKQFIIISFIIVSSFVATAVVLILKKTFENKYVQNKSHYFYFHSLKYFFGIEEAGRSYSKKDASGFQQIYPDKDFKNLEYPLLHNFRKNDVLGPYFEKFDTSPNIVILIVEGLNDDFVHLYKGVELMPFLDSLKNVSLYWNYCFTLGERSFAVVPSLIGSLPYGEKGFTLEKILPRHLSLVSVLNSNNYYTSFFYGQGSWFHRKNRFFSFNDIDLNLDNVKFSNRYNKIVVGNDKFFWGYNDKDLFDQSLKVIDTLRNKLRFDIYFTGTSHSPYIISDQDYYNKQYMHILNNCDNKRLELFKTYKKYFQAIMFVDDALKNYFQNIKSKPGYENTIFLITGDHPCTEIPIANSLKRYHVPLIIYSPKLKTPKTFTKVVSHLDIYETILSLLPSYNNVIPKYSTALGSTLNVAESDRDVKIAFMNDNRDVVDFYSNGYYLSGEKLYKVENDFLIQNIDNNNLLKSIKNELIAFNKTSRYVCEYNKLISDTLYCESFNHKLIYSYINEYDTIKFNTEYYSLVDEIKLDNKFNYYDISFKYYNSNPGDFTLVYQLSNKKNEVVLWKNLGINYNKENYQAHITLLKQNSSDSSYIFKSFFWNKNRKQFSLNQLRILIYEK